jgi:hypothetical protein
MRVFNPLKRKRLHYFDLIFGDPSSLLISLHLLGLDLLLY